MAGGESVGRDECFTGHVENMWEGGGCQFRQCVGGWRFYGRPVECVGRRQMELKIGMVVSVEGQRVCEK